MGGLLVRLATPAGKNTSLHDQPPRGGAQEVGGQSASKAECERNKALNALGLSWAHVHQAVPISSKVLLGRPAQGL
jgi:hypothetical protein